MIGSILAGVSLVGRQWRLVSIGLLLAVILALKLSLGAEQRHSAKLQQRLEETSAAYQRFRADVAAQTAHAKAQDEAHARRVERDQILINQETLSAYQKDIAALRARAAAGVRGRPAPTDFRRGGTAAVPGVPETAGRVDGASGEDRLPQSDALIASEIALQLKALQAWVSAQSDIER